MLENMIRKGRGGGDGGGYRCVWHVINCMTCMSPTDHPLSLFLSLANIQLHMRNTNTRTTRKQGLHGPRPGADPAPRRAALRLRVLLRQRGTRMPLPALCM